MISSQYLNSQYICNFYAALFYNNSIYSIYATFNNIVQNNGWVMDIIYKVKINWNFKQTQDDTIPIYI